MIVKTLLSVDNRYVLQQKQFLKSEDISHALTMIYLAYCTKFGKQGVGSTENRNP